MAWKRLLTLARRPQRPLSATTARSFSNAASVATVSPTTPPPTAMIYDRLAESVKSKLKLLENPDPRFLKYGSPHPTLKTHTHILSSPETRITTLPNGLRVATESNLAARTATVGVWIDAGSRFESDETNGTAHFLEHMIFKGTEKGGVRELEEEIENMGGHLNAYTSREQTTYYAKVMDKDVEGQTEEVIFDHLHATAFQYTPLGAVKHEEFIGEVKKLFTKLSSDPATAAQLVSKDPAYFTGSEVRIIDDDVPLAQFAVAFQGASWTDPDSIALRVMQAMLGSWNKSAGGGKHMGSELAQRVGIDEIAESISGFQHKLQGHWSFWCLCCCEEADVTRACNLVVANVHAFLEKWIFHVCCWHPDDIVIRFPVINSEHVTYAFPSHTMFFGWNDTMRRCIQGFLLVNLVDLFTVGFLEFKQLFQVNLKSSLLLHIDGTSPVAEDIGRQV
ncbi:hypothetical protein POTOM_053898 [Populus tomentosa]|uniref:Uncharacterized protein n=1 Tax=Populus tomentosa TaxID=118781 RepID=A0A8X8C4Z7_POPTO|nr:hypothetical protein POTOM_053898 [Populus tomentosa]